MKMKEGELFIHLSMSITSTIFSAIPEEYTRLVVPKSSLYGSGDPSHPMLSMCAAAAITKIASTAIDDLLNQDMIVQISI